MDYSEVLLGLRQAITCGKISQQDLNIIAKSPEAREALRGAFGSLNVEHINRRLNGAEMSITENDAGETPIRDCYLSWRFSSHSEAEPSTSRIAIKFLNLNSYKHLLFMNTSVHSRPLTRPLNALLLPVPIRSIFQTQSHRVKLRYHENRSPSRRSLGK